MGLGVFGLKSVYKKQLQNIESRKTTNVSEIISYGYITGGQGAVANVCLITRLDFSSETATTTIRLGTRSRSSHGIARNSFYAYMGGGVANGPPPITCSIDRLDFSTETCGILSNYFINCPGIGAVSSNSYGYFGGGYLPGVPLPPGSYNCVIYRLDFSSETLSQPGKNLPYGRSTKGFSSSAYNKGYFLGGDTPPSPTINSITERIDFSNETVTSLPSTAYLARSRPAIAGNSLYGYFSADGSPTNGIWKFDYSVESIVGLPPTNVLTTPRLSAQAVSNITYGYFACGFNNCTIERLQFNNETSSAIPSVIPNSVYIGEGVTEVPGIRSIKSQSFANFPESATYGYFGGGYSNFGPFVDVCTIDRLDFSTETVSAPGKNLSRNRSAFAAVQSNSYGYYDGNYPISSNLIERLDFSTEITSLPGKNSVTSFSTNFGVSSTSYGYFAGGFVPPGYASNVNRLDFSTEITSAPGNNLITARQLAATISNYTYGYFCGGNNINCLIDRIDFSTETITSTGKNLISGRSNHDAVSSSSYGYIGGGNGSPILNIFDFSTENVSGFPSNSIGNFGDSASSNQFYGYWAGGSIPTLSNISRLDFYSLTTSTLPNKLTQARAGLAAVSGGQSQRVLAGRTTGTYGYFGGGGIPFVSTIDRLDFSTETVTTPTPKLSQARSGLAAVSSSSYGYFGGGYAPPDVNTIDRLDFSTETMSAPGKNLTIVRGKLAAVSNNSYGYFGGGSTNNNSSNYNTIDRIDFSNETVQTTSLQNVRSLHTATFNSSYGYFVGGWSGGGTYSSVERLDLSTQTISTISNFLSNRRQLASVSSASYGYFGGGEPGSNIASSNIQRLDFSTEILSLLTNNLIQERYGLAASSSASYGYFGGGTRSPGNVNTIDRLDFSTESISAPGKNLTLTNSNLLAAVSNDQIASTATKGFSPFSATYGYFIGGLSRNDSGPTPVVSDNCLVYRLDFSSETSSEPGKNLSAGSRSTSIISSSSFAYFNPSNFASDTCLIQRLDFTTENVSFPGKNLSLTTGNMGEINSSLYGYFCGGLTGSTGRSYIQRLDFSNENTTLIQSKLSKDRGILSGLYNEIYGYICGGINPLIPANYSTVDRLDFSTETVSLPGINATFSGFNESQGMSAYSFGYTLGGFGSNSCTLERLDFSTEILTAKFASRSGNECGSAISGAFGYFGGSDLSPSPLTPPVARYFGRLDFNTEVVSSSNASVAPTAYTGLPNIRGISSAYKPPIRNGWGWRKTYGYFGGGYSPVIPLPFATCRIERLDFSTEIISAPGKNLPQARGSLASVSSTSYGYFGGGDSVNSTIDRIDFSTETIFAPGKNLPQAKSNMGTVSSNSYGYFGGGNAFPNIVTCSIQRLEFSTELVTLSPASLTKQRYGLAGTFTASKGYFGGGYGILNGDIVCTIDRLDLSNDTILNPTTINLLQTTTQLSSVSSASYGYFAGGYTLTPVSSNVCTINRIDFSTETTSSPGKTLILSRRRSSASSSSSYGYFAGGEITICSIDRIDFVTETVNATGKNLSISNYGLAGIQAN